MSPRGLATLSLIILIRRVPRDCIGHLEGGQEMSLKKHPVVCILVIVFALYFCAGSVQAARIIIKPRVVFYEPHAQGVLSYQTKVYLPTPGEVQLPVSPDREIYVQPIRLHGRGVCGL